MTRAPVSPTDFIRETIDPLLDPAARAAKLCWIKTGIQADVGVPVIDASGIRRWQGVPLKPYIYSGSAYNRWRETRLAEIGACEWCEGDGSSGDRHDKLCRRCKGSGKA